MHGFDDIFSKKYNVFLTISSANIFVFLFGDFDVLYKSWLNYSDELIVQVKSVMIFFISNELTHMVHFPTRIFDCASYNPMFFFFLLILVFVPY